MRSFLQKSITKPRRIYTNTRNYRCKQDNKPSTLITKICIWTDQNIKWNTEYLSHVISKLFEALILQRTTSNRWLHSKREDSIDYRCHRVNSKVCRSVFSMANKVLFLVTHLNQIKLNEILRESSSFKIKMETMSEITRALQSCLLIV